MTTPGASGRYQAYKQNRRILANWFDKDETEGLHNQQLEKICGRAIMAVRARDDRDFNLHKADL